MVPVSGAVRTVDRQPVRVAPASPGWGRLDLTAATPPFADVASTPPPVATSPGSQNAGVESEAFVVTWLPVRTVNVRWATRPSAVASSATSLSLQRPRTLTLAPSL